MFNNKRTKALEDRNKELAERLSELSDEIRKLKAACTMRVGEDFRSGLGFVCAYSLPDGRPIATAMDLIKQLMERQKLTVEAVPASPATFTVTKSN